MNLLLVIPARKGSSFYRKNLKPLCGIPLIRYTLEASKISFPHDTVVTTDDPYIIDECDPNIIINERPANLADDSATLDQLIHYIALNYEYETYVLLPPTSPLRTKTHIEEAIYNFTQANCDSLVSVTEELKTIWKFHDKEFIRPLIERTKNRQQEEPCLISNGAIFISKRENILKSHRKISGITMPYIMNFYSSIDIHSQEDINLAEFLLKEK